VCVDNARELCVSRLNNVETGCDDTDRDGRSWLQQHDWGICNGHNGRLEVGTQMGKGKEGGLYSCLLGRSQARGDYVHVCYMRGGVLGQKENKGTYKGSSQ